MEEYRLRVSENVLLWKIVGHKRDEVTEERWRVSSEELHNFFSSPDIVLVINSRRLRWTDLCSTYGERRVVFRVLVAKP